MKRKAFRKLVLSALLLLGASGAKAQVEKGYTVVPMAPEVEAMCNQVIELQIDDPDQGNKIFQKVLKKIQKDKDQLISVGDFFLNKEVYQVANMCANQVYKLDPTYIPGLMFAGQVNKARGFAFNNESFFGLAGQKYEEVLALDSTNVAALQQNVTIYKHINPAAAKVYLERILSQDPNNYSVFKDLGDIADKEANYPEALKNYEKYFSLAPESDRDEIAAQNYLTSIASGQDWAKLSSEARKFYAQWPKDVQIRRMMFFADVYGGDTLKADETVAYLTDPEYSDSVFTYMDYAVAYDYYSKMKNDTPAAIASLQKLLAVDPSKINYMPSLAFQYLVSEEPAKAVATYEDYFQKAETPDRSDYYYYGIACTTLRDKLQGEEKLAIMEKGDKAFLKCLELKDDDYRAARSRASLYLTDASSPQEEVKVRYEALLNLLIEKDDFDNDNFRDEAYKYIVWYYAMKEDVANAKKYLNDWDNFCSNSGYQSKDIGVFKEALK